MNDPLLGRRIAEKIELLELLGKGGMGRVYRAHHLFLKKQVAIKVLLGARGQGAAAVDERARFEREARAASQLDHPNTVTILDYGIDGDDRLPYIAMELVEGHTLESLLAAGPLDERRALAIMAQILAALAAAHDKNIVHRDMKPSNVLLLQRRDDDGVMTDFVKVCDFGLAKVVKADGPGHSLMAKLTNVGAFLGTPAYASPEQARGEPLDVRGDVYACGAMLYRMLAGRAPHVADTAWGVLEKVLTEEPRPLSVLAPNISRETERLVVWAMEKDRQERCPSVRELRKAIVALIDELERGDTDNLAEKETDTAISAASVRARIQNITTEKPPPAEFALALPSENVRPPTRVLDRPPRIADPVARPTMGILDASPASTHAQMPTADEVRAALQRPTEMEDALADTSIRAPIVEVPAAVLRSRIIEPPRETAVKPFVPAIVGEAPVARRRHDPMRTVWAVLAGIAILGGLILLWALR